jgi:hypothetical protein
MQRKQIMSKILFNKEKAFTAFDAIDFTNVTICATRDCPKKANVAKSMDLKL